ncbi:MAG: tRNA lysidine(34) synthetase TilS [Lachnospiraceae bacterium]|nr:tRNA lysidine(34) synthetase TilS [Lachnospiraceae bacterium]
MNTLEFQEKVKNDIQKLIKHKDGDKILVGVSGGADSVALIITLAAIKKELDVELQAIHVEHGLRGGESLRDQDYVIRLCEKLGVPLVCRSAGAMIRQNQATHLSLEEKARDARYELIRQEADKWREVAGGRVYIALAHHGNDNVETIIFNMTRGTGIDGMRGIPKKRGNIIRPMLGMTRDDIEKYLSGLNVHYRTDSTNLDDSYDRNNIRLNVIPVLNQINPRAVEHINASAELLGEMSKYISKQAEDILAEDTYVDGLEEDEISVVEISKQPAFLQREILHLWISKYIFHAKDVSAKHLYDMAGLIDKQAGKRIDLPEDYVVTRTYKGLKIQKKSEMARTNNMEEKQETVVLKTDIERDGYLRVKHGGKSYELKIINGPFSADIPTLRYTKWLDYDKIKDSISIRNTMPGDYIQVLKEGGTQSFAKYCKNEKISQEKRQNISLVCEGNHIIWAVGYRISEKYKMDENTKRVLEIHAMEETINE